MSKIAITGNDNGSGIFTIASPNSDTDRTLTLPDHAGTVLASASITVDETNGRLGIGTSTPNNKLTVAGYSNTDSTNKLAIGDNVDYQGLIHMESASETLTIENTSDYANRAIIFKENGTEQARIAAGGLLKFNSGFGSVVGAYGVRAWCKWNMSSTQTILGSGGVSSITDAGVGRTDINFLETMPDTNYAATYTIGNNIAEWWTGPFTTTSVRCNVYTGSAYTDQNNNSCIVAR